MTLTYPELLQLISSDETRTLELKKTTGELKDGMKIVMVGFGAGLTYGGTYCVWPEL